MLDDRTTFSWEDEARRKTEKALALAQRMVAWFRDNYEDPAESTPFCSAEGGYMYLCGGPYDAREALGANFAADDGISIDELEEIIELAVAEIEEDGVDEWAKVADPEPEPDIIRLLRASDHQWGKGHVHFFYEADSKTLCGRPRAACPGELGFGDEADITCETCRRMLKRKARAEGRTP